MTKSNYQEYCYATYQGSNQSEQLMRCIASVKRDLDWYVRCKPTVVMLCRQAKGNC